MADMNADPARQRFLILQSMRFGGVALAVLGAAIMAGKIHLPQQIGLGLVMFGAIASLLLPALLARKWKSRAP